MWEELQTLDQKINKLRDRVRRATEPAHAASREMVTLVSQEITCVEDDTSEKTATFYNGSGDCYILHRFSVALAAVPPSLTFDARRYTLNRYAFGYSRRIAAFSNPFIDFVWNYLVESRQSAYSRQPIGSSVFNGLERSQAFDLYEPLIIKPADAIGFSMKPIAFALPGSDGKQAGTLYFVNFLAFGYRRPL